MSRTSVRGHQSSQMSELPLAVGLKENLSKLDSASAPQLFAVLDA